MKIHHIRTRNLNSLAGNNTIDFTKFPLRDCGLFAITGPTGAGKSTLLDAITLALYGSTPRIGKVTDTTIAKQGVIVTTGKIEALAEVKWEMNGKVYLNQWLANRNKEQWSVKMILSESIEGNLIQISNTTKDTPKLVEEITKLNADRFTQAILLSQGKFDQFLEMDEGKRYELLEILTNIGIYRKLGKASYTRKTQLENEIDGLTKALGNIRMLTDEEEAELRKKSGALDEKLKQIRSNQKATAIKKQLKEQIRSLETELNDNLRESDENARRMSEIANDQHRLKRYDNCTPLVGAHQQLISLRTNFIKLEEDQETFRKQIAGEEANQATLNAELSAAVVTAVNPENFTDILTGFTDRISSLDNQVREATTQRSNAAARLKTDHERIPDEVRKQLSREAWADSAKVTALSNELQRQHHENREQAGPGTPSEIIQQAEIDIKEYQHKQELIERRTKAVETLENLRRELEENTIKLTQLSDKLNSAKKQSESLEADIRKTEAEAQREKSGELLAELRRNLMPGIPCPCCGSEAHPHSGMPVVFSLDLSEKLTILKERKQKTEAEIRQLDGEVYRQEILCTEGKSKISETENEFTNLKLQTTAYDERQITEALNTLNLRKTAAQQLDKLQMASDAVLHYLNTLAAWHLAGADLDKARIERQTAWSGSDVQSFSNEMRDRWNGNQTRLSERRISLEEKIKQINELRPGLQNQEADFIQNIRTLGFTDEADFTDASSLGNQAEKIRAAVLELTVAASNLKSRMEDVEKALGSLRKQDDSEFTLDQVIREEERLDAELDTVGKQKSQVDVSLGVQEDNRQEVVRIQYQVAVLQKKLHITSKVVHYIGDATGNKFNKHVQRITLRNLLLLANRRLQEMLGRYTLEMGSVNETDKEKEKDQIWMVDRYMADERRTVNTAAGGEKFMISLSLALALSDMARNQVTIESMFIDEGFGTLGQEALANAIGLLEKLQADQGKTVGIISHVESLKEQIHTKIEVRPVGGGLSELHLTPKPVSSAA